jgi:hypothetical protein
MVRVRQLAAPKLGDGGYSAACRAFVSRCFSELHPSAFRLQPSPSDSGHFKAIQTKKNTASKERFSMTNPPFRLSVLLAPFLSALALAAADALCEFAIRLIQAQKIAPFRSFSHLIQPFRTILKWFLFCRWPSKTALRPKANGFANFERAFFHRISQHVRAWCGCLHLRLLAWSD